MRRFWVRACMDAVLTPNTGVGDGNLSGQDKNLPLRSMPDSGKWTGTVRRGDIPKEALFPVAPETLGRWAGPPS